MEFASVNSGKITEKVMKLDLCFNGYTWEDYFYVISEKSGILVTYVGTLDSEGIVVLNRIVAVNEADRFCDIIESEAYQAMKLTIGLNERLFFSYAEVISEHRNTIYKWLCNELINNGINNDSYQLNQTICKGACALFPKKILTEQ